MRPSSHSYAFEHLELGGLRSANELLGKPQALVEQLEHDGYLYLRHFLDSEPVFSARQALMAQLGTGGFVDRHYPLTEAVAYGKERVPLYDDSAFAETVRTLPQLAALNHDTKLTGLFQEMLGGPILNYDYVWVRAARPGEATGCHYDHVYMGRGTSRLYTCWIPLGDIPIGEGPLAVLQGSNHFETLIQTYGQLDVDRDKERLHPALGGWLTLNPNEPQHLYGGRWLTADFRAGDVLVFTSFTLHCSLDNRSADNRIRLSIDIRKQLASEPADPRWVGPKPRGHAE